MRIAFSTMFMQSALGIQRLQADVAYTNAQIAADRRMLAPSDDPAGAVRALGLAESIAKLSQYQTNQTRADLALEFEELTLNELRDTLNAALGIALEVVPGQDPTTLAQYAAQIDSYYTVTLDLANSQDASGHYIFAGTAGTILPFTQASGPGVYAGNAGTTAMRISDASNITVSDTGASVFNPGVVGQDPFDILDDFQTALGGALTDADVSAAVAGLNAAIANIDAVLGSVAARRTQVAAAQTSTLDVLTLNQNALSDLTALDQAEAFIRLQQQQTALQAAEQSFVAVTASTLFDFLSF
jgi:flagellar hook-associated protein 3 FlgL